MTGNKNMLKTKNNRADVKTVSKKKFYGVVEYSKTVMGEDGKKKSVTTSVVLKVEDKTTRLQAKREVEQQAKSFGGKVVYFGAFNGQ